MAETAEKPQETTPKPELSNEDRIVLQGITLPAQCQPWRLRPIVPADVIYAAYQNSGHRDSISLWDFGQGISSGNDVFFTSGTGWIVAQDIKPGASASIHGGCWKGRRGTDTFMHAPTHALLDWLYAQWGLHVLLSAYPEHNRLAAVWDRQYGFVRTGVVPFADFWGGQPCNLILTARFKKTEVKP